MMQELPPEILVPILEFTVGSCCGATRMLRKTLDIAQVCSTWRQASFRYLGHRLVRAFERYPVSGELRTSSVKLWRNFQGVAMDKLLIQQAEKSACKALTHPRELSRCRLDIGLPLDEGHWFSEAVFGIVVGYNLFAQRYPNLHRILEIVQTLPDELLQKRQDLSSFYTWMWYIGKVHLIDITTMGSEHFCAMADHELRHPHLPRFAAELAFKWMSKYPNESLTPRAIRRLVKVGATRISRFVYSAINSFDVLCAGDTEAIALLHFRCRYYGWHHGDYYVFLHYARKNYVDAIRYCLESIKRDHRSMFITAEIFDRLKHAVTIAKGRKFHEAARLLEEFQRILNDKRALIGLCHTTKKRKRFNPKS